MQDVTHPDDLGRNLPPFAALAEGRGGPFVIEKRCVRPDGAAVWVQNSVSAIRDNQGRAAAKRAAASESSHGARGWS